MHNAINKEKINNKMEKRSLRLYPEENEYLIAIKEDLSEWLEKLYPNIDINSSNFFNKLETGSLLMQVLLSN